MLQSAFTQIFEVQDLCGMPSNLKYGLKIQTTFLPFRGYRILGTFSVERGTRQLEAEFAKFVAVASIWI